MFHRVECRGSTGFIQTNGRRSNSRRRVVTIPHIEQESIKTSDLGFRHLKIDVDPTKSSIWGFDLRHEKPQMGYRIDEILDSGDSVRSRTSGDQDLVGLLRQSGDTLASPALKMVRAVSSRSSCLGYRHAYSGVRKATRAVGSTSTVSGRQGSSKYQSIDLVT